MTSNNTHRPGKLSGALVFFSLLFAGQVFADPVVELDVLNVANNNGDILVVGGEAVEVGFNVVSDTTSSLTKKDNIQLVEVSTGDVLAAKSRGAAESGSISLVVPNGMVGQIFVQYVINGENIVVATSGDPNDLLSSPIFSVAELSLSELATRVSTLESGDIDSTNESQSLSSDGKFLTLSNVDGIGGGIVPLPQGPVGPQGITGLQGLTGLTGPAGPQGNDGAAGIQGIPGNDGIAGADGLQGPQGFTGATGPAGPQGILGLTGDSGAQGLPGNDGVPGVQGPQGLPGIDGISAASPGNIVIVAPSGGDYTSPLNAMANIESGDTWCGTPSAVNPCLIRIAPGVYDLGAVEASSLLVMRPFVDIEGSGQNTTRITARGSYALAGYPATVATATNSELRNITIENTGTSTYAVAISGSGSTHISQLTNVTAIATGASGTSTAIVNQNTQNLLPKLRNVTATAEGPTAVGILNSCSAADIDGAVVTATGTISSIAIQDSNGSGCGQTTAQGRLTNVKAIADGGNNAYGISATQSSTQFSNVDVLSRNGLSQSIGIFISVNSHWTLSGSRIEAIGAPVNIGIIGVDGSVTVDNSVITADTATVDVGGELNSILIGASRLVGGSVLGSGASCAGVFDESNIFFNNTCP